MKELTERQKSWVGKMKPTRRIKVNTIVRGRGRVLLHAKSCNGLTTGYWYVIKEGDKYVSLLSIYSPQVLGHKECTPYSRYEASSLKEAYKELSCEIRKCIHSKEAWQIFERAYDYEEEPCNDFEVYAHLPKIETPFDWEEDEWN